MNTEEKNLDDEKTEAFDETVEETTEDVVDDNVEVLDAEKTEEKQEDDYKEKYYYLAAEMDNLRKRNEREKDNLLKFGAEKILKSLIEVVDNLDRTIDATKDETDEKVLKITEGVEMIRKQFLDVLGNNGLEKVDAVGEVFDPNFHEALSQVQDDTKKDNGRLLRAAKVVIAKN